MSSLLGHSPTGITEVESAYCNGHVMSPTYEQVCSGRTGHAEVVRLRFDDEVVSFRDLLEIFFVIHDPTTPDRQGNDVGPQYRSAIFTTTAEQKQIADAYIAQLDQAKIFARPIATKVEDFKGFYPAEAYHQDYFEQHPNQGYCAFVVAPKVAKFEQYFTRHLKP